MTTAKKAFSASRPPEEQGSLTKDELIGVNSSVANKYQQLLEWHGVTTSVVNAEFIGDCPFADCPSFIDGKPDKFTMNRQTAQWQCFVCGRKGNAYTFLENIHHNWLQQTTEEHYTAVRVLRKNAVDLIDLVEMQIAYNGSTKEWMFPAWNSEGKVSNLYVWREQFSPSSGKKFRQFMSSPSCSHVPYGIHRLRSGTNRPIWVVEGHWDYIAAMGLFRRLGLSGTMDLLAAPGAGTFPRKHLSIFNGRDVILCFDNDPAGVAGMDGIITNMVSNHVMPTSIKRIIWPASLSQGFDVSDVITSLPQSLWKKT